MAGEAVSSGSQGERLEVERGGRSTVGRVHSGADAVCSDGADAWRHDLTI
jgi:hypothetical protein